MNIIHYCLVSLTTPDDFRNMSSISIILPSYMPKGANVT